MEGEQAGAAVPAAWPAAREAPAVEAQGTVPPCLTARNGVRMSAATRRILHPLGHEAGNAAH